MSHETEHDEHDEHLASLTGAYVLDALDPLERARVERHLSTCPRCSEEVRSFQETTARLAAGTATSPPPGLRARVLAEAATTQQLPPAAERAPEAPPRGTRRVTTWLAAAAVVLFGLTVAAGWLAVRAQRDAAEAREFAAAVSTALTDPDREVLGAEFADGRATVIVSDDEVTVIGADVRPPGDQKAFQLWFVGPEGPRPSVLLQRVDGGTVWARAEGVRPGDALAVTVEPAEGSQSPTSDPVMVTEPVGS